MKLILTHEVSNLGAPGDIVDVKDGYGRNFLLPRGYAIRWTRGAARQVESIKAARDARSVHDLEAAQGIAAKLAEAPINLTVKAGESGRLFGSVTVGDIAEALEDAGAKVDKRRIDVGNQIKSTGVYDIKVGVHPEVVADVKLNVVPGK